MTAAAVKSFVDDAVALVGANVLVTVTSVPKAAPA